MKRVGLDRRGLISIGTGHFLLVVLILEETGSHSVRGSLRPRGESLAKENQKTKTKRRKRRKRKKKMKEKKEKKRKRTGRCVAA